jgi:hypothetical protein
VREIERQSPGCARHPMSCRFLPNSYLIGQVRDRGLGRAPELVQSFQAFTPHCRGGWPRFEAFA